MKILFLSSQLPHARVIGGHKIVYQRIKRLAERGHEVGLCTFRHELEDKFVAELKPLLLELERVPLPKPRGNLNKAWECVVHSRPPLFSSVRSIEMQRVIGDMVERSGYDVVIAEFTKMGQYLYKNPYLPAVRKIVSCHLSATTVARKMLALKRWSLDYLKLWICMKHLAKMESEIYRSVDRVLCLTAEERYALQRYAPNARTRIIPYCVDVDYFRPRTPLTGEDAIMFTGHYKDEANLDAVMWFHEAVWPILRKKHPNLKFYVVGPHPTRAMRGLSSKDSNIVVTGEVKDIRPYFSKSHVYVCPVRIGSGMRGKILEAMSAQLPVVSTTLGAQGIPSQPGENCFLADDPTIMAEHISLLLEDEDLRIRIEGKARKLVLQRFSWERGIDLLEEVLQDATRKTRF